jgi:hypothetical protein
MNAFKYTDEISAVLTNDTEILNLLKVNTKSLASYSKKFRRRDQQVDEFEPTDLDFIAFYFVDADQTQNAYMNKGLLRVEIYSKTRAAASKIRNRVVALLHDKFDLRVAAEGQKISGIKDIYKYRLEYTPLIFN